MVATIIEHKRRLEQQPGASTKINIIIYSDLYVGGCSSADATRSISLRLLGFGTLSTERDPLRFQRDAELTLEVMKLYPDVVYVPR